MIPKIALTLMVLPILGCSAARAVDQADLGASSPLTADGSAGPPAVADLSVPADLTLPDLSPSVDVRPGGPCPCTGELVCIDGTCRTQCSPPTDPCGVSSNCPSDHGCFPHANGYACVPAADPGFPCSSTLLCPVDHVCGSLSGGAYKCLPICSSAGAPCGAGGTCVMASGCSFCSSI